MYNWGRDQGVWLKEDCVSKCQVLVAVGSRRYAEWENWMFQATTEAQDELED
ncbi:hypothetical protein PC116_g27262 [Phytophthora cactorum]|nr:hypothetical protein PC114_g25747 [Phytophthora cactorum]KAG4224281.1 hypothetical protein PC116_g27262 [Phytophthora cactorum]